MRAQDKAPTFLRKSGPIGRWKVGRDEDYMRSKGVHLRAHRVAIFGLRRKKLTSAVPIAAMDGPKNERGIHLLAGDRRLGENLRVQPQPLG